MSRDALLADALQIVHHDAGSISSLVRRALESRVRSQEDPSAPISAHCDGLAKTVLVLIERSSHAWRAIAQLGCDDSLAGLLMQLHNLREGVGAEFPKAWRFIRPGLDEPWR